MQRYDCTELRCFRTSPALVKVTVDVHKPALDGYRILASFIARNRGQISKSSTLRILGKSISTCHGIKCITHARWTRPFAKETANDLLSRKRSLATTTTTTRRQAANKHTNDCFGASSSLTIFKEEIFQKATPSVTPFYSPLSHRRSRLSTTDRNVNVNNVYRIPLSYHSNLQKNIPSCLVKILNSPSPMPMEPMAQLTGSEL